MTAQLILFAAPKIDRRSQLLAAIRANMLRYADEIEAGLARWPSLSAGAGIPEFNLCAEHQAGIRADVAAIRATYASSDWHRMVA
jgi:hypothetical protein